MERRAFAAILLSLLVIVGWQFLFPPPEKPAPAQPADTADVAEPVGTTADPVDSSPPTDVAAPVADPNREPIEETAERTIRVETDVFDVELTNRGARAISWKLKEYTDRSGAQLELVPEFTDGRPGILGIALESQAITEQLQESLFTVERRTDRDAQVVTFRWSDGTSLEIERTLTFRRGDYLVDLDQRVIDRGRPALSAVSIGPGFGAQESASGRSRFYSQAGGAVWSVDDDVTHRKTSKLDEGGSVEGDVKWAGLEDQYFAALVLPSTESARVAWSARERITKLKADEEEDPEAELQPRLTVGIASSGASVYIGPKQMEAMQATGAGLEDSIRFYGWLQWLARLIHKGLLWIHANITSNWGLAIILATIALRTTLFPLNQFAMIRMKKSQLDMQRIQPRLAQVRNKYRKRKDAESRAAMQREQMDVYREEGINPAGPALGCLPMLIQFPILIAFYNMLTVAIELRGAPFALWIQDLAVPDPFWVTPLLMGATMFAQQRMSMTKVKDPQQRQQQQIMMFMPFVFTALCISAPSGLVLYWFVNNVLGMGQQWLVNKQFERAHGAGTDEPKKSGSRSAKSPKSKSPRTRNA